MHVDLDLDVDVCDRSVAPACPASVPGGIAAYELRAAARVAGAHPAVRSVDITEIDATADVPNHRTVRLAALCVLEVAAGLTVPVQLEARLVDFHLDSAALDDAMDELAAEEGLTDEQQALLTKKAGRWRTVMLAPVRIKAVCADIVYHYHSRVAPSGQKAQVVAADRERLSWRTRRRSRAASSSAACRTRWVST